MTDNWHRAMGCWACDARWWHPYDDPEPLCPNCYNSIAPNPRSTVSIGVPSTGFVLNLREEF
jgi:hypothetical protein